MLRKRGQASVDFILTYGWAILLFILVIAVLVYFQITPLTYTARSCILFPGLLCESHKATPTKVILLVGNYLGQAITINSINVETCATPASGSLSAGGRKTFYMLNCTNGKVGSRFKKEINIIYTDETGFSYAKKGLLITTISPDSESALGIEDITPPWIFNIVPANGSILTATSITLSSETDENANCQFSLIPFEYDSGFDFTTTGLKAHSSNMALQDNRQYIYHIKCKDSSGNYNTDENEGITTFKIDTTYVPPGEGEPGGEEGGNTTTATSYSYKRTVAFTENRGIARNSPYSFSFNPNSHVQSDCDDVIVKDGTTEIPSNIISCSGSSVELAVNLNLAASGTKSLDVYYGNSAAAAPSYRTDGTEPITGKIIVTGLWITVNSGTFSKYKQMYSAIYQWALGSSSGVIGCGSGNYCEEQGELTDVNSYAGTSYTFNSASATGSLVTNGVKNYNLVVYGNSWSINGDHSQSEYNEYLRLGGSLLFTGQDSFSIPFTTSFLPDDYNFRAVQRNLDCSQFPCSASDSSHSIGDNTFCGDWGYSCQTKSAVDISSNSRYYKVWSTAYTNPTLAIAGLNSPYTLSYTIGAETAA